MTIQRVLSHLCTIAIAGSAFAGGDTPVPLIDLGSDTYLGAEGGLYPGGSNAPPAAHLAAALAFADAITPLDGQGNPDPHGLIGFLTVGMSNTTQEFGVFAHDQDGDSNRNPRVLLLGTTQGGQDSTAVANPNGPYWSGIDTKLADAGVSAEQIQVCWVKQAKQGPTGAFPIHAEAFRDELRTIAQILHDRFPNLKLCYFSSRVYAGYAVNSSNPEPFAYESGFGVKWMIEDQINGDPSLNYGQLPGDIEAPLLLWGPYLWANGDQPNGNGTTWLPEDFEQNGTNHHPAGPGEQKVADLLTGFFSTDITTQSWWWKEPGTSVVIIEPDADASVSSSEPDTNFGSTPILITRGGNEPARSHLRFTGTVAGDIDYARISLRVDEFQQGGAGKIEGTSGAWDENAVTFNTAPILVPPVIGDIPLGYSRGGYTTTRVTHALSPGLESIDVALIGNNNAPERAYNSKEGAHPPRLIVIVSVQCPGDLDGSGQVDAVDLLALLALWGPCPGCDADLTGDRVVDATDLLALLAAWGACEE